jgi:hypothetical protein
MLWTGLHTGHFPSIWKNYPMIFICRANTIGQNGGGYQIAAIANVEKEYMKK